MSRRTQRTKRTKRTERNAARRKRYGLTGDMTRFVVQTPFCAPARYAITAALSEGIKGRPDFCPNCRAMGHACAAHAITPENYEEAVWMLPPYDVRAQFGAELRSFKNLKFGPLAAAYLHLTCRATFDVPTNLAVFVEYVIENTSSLYVSETHRLDRGARRRADRRGRRLPTRIHVDGPLSIIDKAKQCAKSHNPKDLPPEFAKAATEAGIYDEEK